MDEDVGGGVDIDLEEAGFVNGGVEEGEEALVCDVRASLTDVPTHLPHHSDMFIAVQ